MEKKKKWLIICLLFNFFYLYAQPEIHALKVGDKMPDLILNQLVNYSSEQLKLSEIKKDLLVLDFWMPSCGACLKAFPEMDALQRQFSDRMKILAVTRSDTTEMKRKMQRSIVLKTTSLTLVIGDTVLNSLFPHRAEPFHVWIDRNGIVRAMTDGSNTTPTHVEEFLEGMKVTLPSIAYPDFDYNESILTEGNHRQLSNISCYSLIAKIGTTQSMAGSLIDSSENKVVGMHYFNFPMYLLFAFAYDMPIDKVKLDMPDAENYFEPHDLNKISKWKSDNLYSYEIKLPNVSDEYRKKMMQQDLQRFFGVTSEMEKKSIKCLVLKRIMAKDKLKAEDSNEKELHEYTEAGVNYRNAFFSYFISDVLRPTYFQKQHKNVIPLIDETGLSLEKVDIEIQGKIDDIKLLNEQLKKYGLVLSLRKKKVKVLVIRRVMEEYNH